MMGPSGYHPRRGLGGRKPEPVCSEPQAALGNAEHLEGDAAAAERYARTAFGVVDDAGFYAKLDARTAKDDRAYAVVAWSLGVMLAAAVAAVSVYTFILRTKPIAVYLVPSISRSYCPGSAGILCPDNAKSARDCKCLP